MNLTSQMARTVAEANYARLSASTPIAARLVLLSDQLL